MMMKAHSQPMQRANNGMVDRHHKMIDTIITDTTDRENLFKSVDALFEQLKSIYFGVYLIHDLSEKTQDAIVSYGERLSSKKKMPMILKIQDISAFANL